MINREELLQALQGLGADQIAHLINMSQRSPLRDRQLTDLTLRPSARDPRPTFYAETDAREFQPIKHSDYPRLLWHKDTGQEIRVESEKEERARGASYLRMPPTGLGSCDPEEQARKLFESLSDEDKAFMVEHQHQLRLDAVKKAMAGLTTAQAAAVVAMPVKNGKKNGDRP